jgi:hypothetical protein
MVYNMKIIALLILLIPLSGLSSWEADFDDLCRFSLAPAIPWTPSNITTVAWYDSADTSKILTTGTAVTNWLDKSGNNLKLIQTTAAQQPKNGSLINGLNAITFSNSLMMTASNPFAPTISNAFVIVVQRVDATVNGILFSLSNSTTTRWQAHAPWGEGTMYFDCGGSVAPYRINIAYGVTAGTVVITSFYCSSLENVQQVYKNGSLLVGDATGHNVTTAGNISIGGWSTASYQRSTMGEFIIIKGTVDTNTRQKLEGYLAWKWGRTSTLPAGHPYKDKAPTL